MRLIRLALPPLLARQVHQIWLFESACGLPVGDLRTVVPNGRTRLILPLVGGLTASAGSRRWEVPAGRAVLVGQWERPAILSAPAEPLATIGVEFTTTGLAAFHAGPLSALSGEIVDVEDVLGPLARRLMERTRSAQTPLEAAHLVRAGLAAWLLGRDVPTARLSDVALRMMRKGNYRLGLEELAQRTGYSRRHLLTQFQRDIGLSPSRIQTILAFEQLYRGLAQHGSALLMIQSALDRFHDQAHFTRVFRDLAGLPPARFAARDNRFGRLFYEEAADRSPASSA